VQQNEVLRLEIDTFCSFRGALPQNNQTIRIGADAVPVFRAPFLKAKIRDENYQEMKSLVGFVNMLSKGGLSFSSIKHTEAQLVLILSPACC
jgi:hypothetical protein